MRHHAVMPTDEARAREDAVLALVCRELSRDGRTITVEAQPDRLPPAERSFTVDALLRVRAADGERVWAADVCTVPLPNDMPGALRAFEARALPELTRLAKGAGRAVTISLHPRLFPPRTSRGDQRRQHAADLAAILRAAEQALASGEDLLPAPDDELKLQIFVHDEPTHADGTAVAFMPFVGGTNPDITAQLRRDLAPAVLKKLSEQLRTPHEAGYPTLLILDQVGHGEMAVPTNFLASPGTIRTVVAECVTERPGVLNACLLVTRDHELVDLLGQVGRPTGGLADAEGPDQPGGRGWRAALVRHWRRLTAWRQGTRRA
jgi:hypothetical protein